MTMRTARALRRGRSLLKNKFRENLKKALENLKTCDILSISKLRTLQPTEKIKMTRQEAIQQAKKYILLDATKFLNTSEIMNCVVSMATDYDPAPERACDYINEEIDLFIKGLQILKQTIEEGKQGIIDADK